MIEDMGGADVCYGGCGWNGHIAFFEPHIGAGFGDDMDAFMQQGAQIVDLHPLTIAQNSLFCDAGASGAWHRVPPKAATIGPKDLVNSKVNKCYHWFAYGDVSWQRFITPADDPRPRDAEGARQHLSGDRRRHVALGQGGRRHQHQPDRRAAGGVRRHSRVTCRGSASLGRETGIDGDVRARNVG